MGVCVYGSVCVWECVRARVCAFVCVCVMAENLNEYISSVFLPGKILVYYQYQILNSKGESQTI